MTQRFVDVDDDLLDAARDLLGTDTPRDTVTAALHAATELELRRRRLVRLHGDARPDLQSTQVMDDASR